MTEEKTTPEEPQYYLVRIPELATIQRNDNDDTCIVLDKAGMREVRARINNILSKRAEYKTDRCPCGKYSKWLADKRNHRCGTSYR